MTGDRSMDVSTNTVQSAGAASLRLTIHYDAASRTYTLTPSAPSQKFGPADLDGSSTPGRATYTTLAGTLALKTASLNSGTPISYVGLGVWQHRLSDSFLYYDVFTYGFSTPASGVPRSGSAAYNIDINGALFGPGLGMKTFQGSGTLNADFGVGRISVSANAAETNVFGSVANSNATFQAGGPLSSAGDFGGRSFYQDASNAIRGELAGRLYGPAAEEVGASFGDANPAGVTFVGGLIGRRASSSGSGSLTMANLQPPQSFDTHGMSLYGGIPPDGTTFAPRTLASSRVQMTLWPDGLGFASGSVTQTSMTLTDFALSGQPAQLGQNFTAYTAPSVNGSDERIQLYKAGSANTELELTYATLGTWQEGQGTTAQPSLQKLFFAYGYETPAAKLLQRTGSAQYSGVVYGYAGDTNANQYDVKGASQFNVNFSAQTVSGTLAFKGVGASGPTARDFGSFDVSGSTNPAGGNLILNQSGAYTGELTGRFYGPDVNEFGGAFEINVGAGPSGPAAMVSGATVAKR